MEKQAQQQEQQFIKGFNNGYLLAQHEPKLAAQLSATPNSQSDYYKGLINGKDQYEKEMREATKAMTKKPPVKGDREMDFER